MLIEDYCAKREEVDKYDILIAYESVGGWGCGGSSFFLLRDKETGKLYENHCSCYGFEDQFRPEEITIGYLKSNNFYFETGGYDEKGCINEEKVKEYIRQEL